MRKKKKAATKAATIEKRQRFSRSALWRWQSEYFDSVGIEAWAGPVPFFATSSTHIAASYALIIARYLAEASRRPDFDAASAVPIIELGAGSGQFSYYCVRYLCELCRALSIPARPCWVMTDFAQSNIDFWRDHDQFRPFIEEGLLDMARFDVTEPGPIRLLHRDVEISPDHPASASVCIANYVFDSTPHDLFRIEGGKVSEVTVSLSGRRMDKRRKRPGLISEIDCEYHTSELETLQYYELDDLNSILASYAEHTDLTGTFVFPVAMLSAIDWLRRTCGGRLLLLASDKGYVDIDDIVDRAPPKLADHQGAFSLTVNFDAVRRYAELANGRAFHQSLGSAMQSCAYLLDPDGTGSYVETAHAIGARFQKAGPGDFFSMYRFFRDSEAFDLQCYLGLLRSAGWDPHLVTVKAASLYARLDAATDSQRRALYEGLREAESLIYAKPGMKDHYSSIAMLYYGLSDFGNAARLYAFARERLDPTFETCFNFGLCCFMEDRKEEAAAAFAEARDLEPPDGTQAQSWLDRLAGRDAA